MASLPSVTIVDRLSDHHSSGNVSLDIRNSPELTKQRDNGAVFLHRLFCPGAKASGTRLSDDVEVVFERDRQAMQWTYRLPGLTVVLVQLGRSLNGIVEHGHRKAVCLKRSQLTNHLLNGG